MGSAAFAVMLEEGATCRIGRPAGVDVLRIEPILPLSGSGTNLPRDSRDPYWRTAPAA